MATIPSPGSSNVWKSFQIQAGDARDEKICTNFTIHGYAGGRWCGKAADPKPAGGSPEPAAPAAPADVPEKRTELAKADGITIWASQPAEGDLFKEITVQTKERSQTFSWSTSSNPTYYPAVKLGNFYTGNTQEIAVILTKGYGTGVLQQELHVLNLADLSEIPVENPEDAVAKKVKSKITKAAKTVRVELEAGGKPSRKSTPNRPRWYGMTKCPLATPSVMRSKATGSRRCFRGRSVPGRRSPLRP
ncbi:hypothetical protein LJK88_02315 [Paenibacillus sp. P26]|nr:hypothetical protein LJK88_02315 [Paenibacillus sp. P26]